MERITKNRKFPRVSHMLFKNLLEISLCQYNKTLKAKEKEKLSSRWDECLYLLLKSKDVSNTAVYRIPEPSLRLVTYCYHRIQPFMDRDVQKKLRYIASPKHLVDSCEMGRPLLRVEVRRKYTPGYTLPPQKFARTAWPSTTTTATAASATTSTTTSWVGTHLFLFKGFPLFLFALSLRGGERVYGVIAIT